MTYSEYEVYTKYVIVYCRTSTRKDCPPTSVHLEYKVLLYCLTLRKGIRYQYHTPMGPIMAGVLSYVTDVMRGIVTRCSALPHALWYERVLS